jgi:AcrR family transcriptional regulator
MADKRQAILSASAKTIAQHGVRGMRVTEVAASAGVSTALLYYHFTDRAGLLDAALNYMMEQSREYRSRADNPGDTAWQRLLNHLSLEFQDDPIVTETTLAWNELRASAVYEPGLRASLATAAADWREEIREAIQAAQDAGEVPATADAAGAAATLVALMEGFGSQWICGELTVAEVQAHLTATATALLRPTIH